ncbi:hypothetical protein ACET3Z_029495 [Daucus carota]
MDHHHLLTIDESRTDWMLKVRVTRIWATMSRNGVAVRHNLILLDCQHNHIHAMVPTRLWHLYENLIVEDVIGVLGIVQEFQTVETGSGATRVLRFSISDERYRFDVAFWDPLNFDVDPLFENHLDIPVIVILASIRLTLVDGVLTITNISSTKVYINLGHQDVFMMRQRMVNEPFLM